MFEHLHPEDWAIISENYPQVVALMTNLNNRRELAYLEKVVRNGHANRWQETRYQELKKILEQK